MPITTVKEKSADLQDLSFGQSCAAVELPPCSPFRVCVSPAPLSPRHALGVQTGAVLISTQNSFGVRVRPVPFASSHPSFGNGVLDVGLLGTVEQVLRADTALDVAVVAGLIHQRSDKPLVRNDVGQPGLPVKTEGGVPVGVASSRPQPARPKLGAMLRDWPVLVYLRPEAGEIGLVGGYNAHAGHLQSVRPRPGQLTLRRGIRVSRFYHTSPGGEV